MMAVTPYPGWPARSRTWSKVRRGLALLSVWAFLDVVSAQVLKHTLDKWDPFAGEKSYRVASAVYHHGLAKNVRTVGAWGNIEYPYATNSLGFRDAEVREVPLTKSNPRVLFIGDSFTEGVGVSHADTFIGLLAPHFSFQRFEILNAAVSSYAPVIYYRKIKYLLQEAGLEFDFVVVAIDISDVADEALTYRVNAAGHVVEITPDPLGARIGRVLKDNSLLLHVGPLLVHVLRQHFDRRKLTALGVGNARGSWATSAQAYRAYGIDGLRRSSEHMDQLLALLRQRHIGMAVMVYPWPDQIINQDSTSMHVTFWRRWAQTNRVPLFNLFPAFLSNPDPMRIIQENFIRSDVHWNAHGHGLVASALRGANLADTVAHHIVSSCPRAGSCAGEGSHRSP